MDAAVDNPGTDSVRRFFYTEEVPYGLAMIAQCALVPPHEDMWVECRRFDAQGRQIHEIGQAVTRDMLRVNFRFQLPHDLVAGDYHLIVRCNGNDVLSRNVRVSIPTPMVLSN